MFLTAFCLSLCSWGVLMSLASIKAPSLLWLGAPTGWNFSLEMIKGELCSPLWTWTRWETSSSSWKCAFHCMRIHRKFVCGKSLDSGTAAAGSSNSQTSSASSLPGHHFAHLFEHMCHVTRVWLQCCRLHFSNVANQFSVDWLLDSASFCICVHVYVFVCVCRGSVNQCCCWRSPQVLFRWSTVTRCFWSLRSRDLCCTAHRNRKCSSWAPNLVKGILNTRVRLRVREFQRSQCRTTSYLSVSRIPLKQLHRFQ